MVKKQWKPVWAVVLTFALILSMFPMPTSALDKGKSTLVVVHYQEAPDNEKDWNLWLWANGPDYFPNKGFTFNGEDAFGKVAAYEFPVDSPEKIGLIVRTDNWDKDKGSENDRFITSDMIQDGVAEVWIKSGDPTIYTSNPDGETASTEIDMKVHYFRYDNTYTDWGLWAWPDGGDGQSIAFDEADDFGAVANVKLANPESKKLMGLITKKGEWTEKDGEDRFVLGTAKEVWLVEGDSTIYYSEPQIDRSPKLVSFSADTFRQATLTTNRVITDAFIDELSVDGATVESIEKASDKSVTIQFKADIDLAKVIKASHPEFGEQTLQAGKVLRSKEFDAKYAYDGKLGVTYQKSKTKFVLWAPTAQQVELELWNMPTNRPTNDKDMKKVIQMKRGERGTWVTEVRGDLDGIGYTYQVTHATGKVRAVDPYATAVGVNGDQGVIVDLKETDPKRWNSMKPKLKQSTDAIIYETHVRDFSIFDVKTDKYDSGIQNKGKYLGVIEPGTRLLVDGKKTATKTGLDHVKDLGVTHVQFIPVYDFNTASVDETNPMATYNWGYDPKNYNAPEGSYSTNPYDAKVRIMEMKQMIQGLHDNNLRAVMDVVYNHMFDAQASNLHKIVPGYYYRYTAGGDFANGTGVGNDTASERAMMQKLIVDSVVYWAKEYHWDGFRFDLMGIHDVDTMNKVRSELNRVDKSILVFGEGWDLGTPLDAELKANQKNAYDMPGIAHFNDNIRDGLKGSVFFDEDKGFVNGKEGMENRVKTGIVGEIAYSDTIKGFTKEPTQAITYVEAHDNHTLWDKLELTNPTASEMDKTKMHRLASSIILTSQGTTFLHAGQEFMRTKEGDHNSYKSPDSINQLDWKRAADRKADVQYMKGLIEMRKANPGLRMTKASDVKRFLTFHKAEANVITYTIDEDAPGQKNDLFITHNANPTNVQVTLPKGSWNVIVDGDRAGTKTIKRATGKVNVPAYKTFVLERN
ncbi:Pullulanase, type I [Exiguobacterium sp. 8H]|uniref:type I pullulanase n=1 Tax=unclassified Exiguobacterium TaxID=2644629 RepID=UPI0012F19FA8|nr:MULTISPECIES: type I pullulanase [unclassified Exiguobacterium]VXB54247.1 Pullulanase, type I [Exiguobacterium sp. 8A]VXB54989.1 Pullulanase, type I [Exiguobacterium sp. 8H]